VVLKNVGLDCCKLLSVGVFDASGLGSKELEGSL